MTTWPAVAELLALAGAVFAVGVWLGILVGRRLDHAIDARHEDTQEVEADE